jgi:hypothetical protein
VVDLRAVESDEPRRRRGRLLSCDHPAHAIEQTSPSGVVDRLDHLVDVVVHLHLRPDGGDLALLVDQVVTRFVPMNLRP